MVLNCRVSRYHSYLNSAKEIISSYKGEEPFASYIKKFFAGQKKIGSRDRKEISQLCYGYFRMGKALQETSTIEEQLLTGLFLCTDKPNAILDTLKPGWNDKVQFSIKEKLSSLHFQLSSVFPWKDELSEGIEYEKFCASFFIQPDLFLRIRPDQAKKVLFKLNASGVQYEFISPFTVRLPNSFKANEYFELDKEVVVQDYSSQQIFNYIPVRPAYRTGRRGSSDRGSDRVWDCCAGSGGKSIMAFDLDPGIELTVSDVRETILANLKKRFERAGIKKYKSFVIDLTHSPLTTHHSPFDLIIADVPCTGSGTWSRTPEQLHYFNPEKISEYAELQKKIISNIMPHLQPGGHLLYSTCSVFKKENEEVVNFLKEKFQFQLLKLELLRGYELKADTMFAALLLKPL